MDLPQQRLPNAELAVVSAAKLRDYMLNPAHPQGGPKARVFAAVLGLTRSDWRYLREQLVSGVQRARATPRGSTQWGDLYEALVDVQGRNGRIAGVRTGWILRFDDERPHSRPRMSTFHRRYPEGILDITMNPVRELDSVALRRPYGRWVAGTTGVVVETFDDEAALVEFVGPD